MRPGRARRLEAEPLQGDGPMPTRSTRIERRLPRLHAALRLLGMTEDEASSTLYCASRGLSGGPEVCDHLGGTAASIRHARDVLRKRVAMEKQYADGRYTLPDGMGWQTLATARALDCRSMDDCPTAYVDGFVFWSRGGARAAA